MERYKIGDVAKFLGISPDLLRYYEKKGVVKPSKDKNNDYRYYDFWDINFLLDCLWFKRFGFSIDRISDMVRVTTAEEMGELFLAKEEELRQQIYRSQLLLERAAEHRADLERIKALEGKCEIAPCPECVRYFNRYMNSYKTTPALQRLSHDWLELMPFVHRCFEISEQESSNQGDDRDYRWGFSMSMEYVKKLKVRTDPPVAYVPASPRTIHSVFRSTGKGNFSPRLLGYMMDYAEEHGLEISGPPRGVLLASVLKGEDLTGYFEVWIPIV